MPHSKRILVTRFSALGDVAMTVPVILSFVEQYPDFELVFVSQGFALPLIKQIPGVTFLQVDLKAKHKGLLGLWKLSRQLVKSGDWYAFADLHDVLRTKILRLFLCFSIKKFAAIDKGRKEKRWLTQRYNKKKVQLKHTVNRYSDVFNKLGFVLTVNTDRISIKTCSLEQNERILIGEKNCKWVGIAPFAKHKGKSYPIDRMITAIGQLSNESNVRILLFGGGKEEVNQLAEIERRFQNTLSVAGKLNLEAELKIMSMLDVIVTMDSANMHLASLVGTKVISIWGATHPFAGFYGFNQSHENAVQNEDLDCRPCSVFGNKPCFRKDYACMMEITPLQIVEKVKSHINQQ